MTVDFTGVDDSRTTTAKRINEDIAAARQRTEATSRTVEKLKNVLRVINVVKCVGEAVGDVSGFILHLRVF